MQAISVILLELTYLKEKIFLLLEPLILQLMNILLTTACVNYQPGINDQKMDYQQIRRNGYEF